LVGYVLVCAALPATAQRRPVLPQIAEPHPYYYRELYLPQLTSGPSSLTWGPDSKELIYSMAGSLWRQKLDSNEAVQLTDGAGYDYQPDWSPDGKSVVYVSYQKDAVELWLLELASGKTQPLTDGGAVNVEPRWSPDGKKLVWVSTEYNGRFHVFMGAVAGGKLTEVVRLTGETRSSLPRYYYSQYDMEINPAWARDGKEILFVSNQGHIHGTGGFWLMKAEPGAKAREIHYEETNWKARPDFSPDGARMVYSSYLGRQWHNLWVMPATGGDAFPISYGDWDETNARWSPDGKCIAFVSNQNGNTELRIQDWPDGKAGPVEVNRREYLSPREKVLVGVRKDQIGVYARVSVTDARGKFLAPEDVWIYADDGFDRSERVSERHYFYPKYRDGAVVYALPGPLTVEVSKGPEFRAEKKTAEVRTGEELKIYVDLAANSSPGGGPGHWISGDMHVHQNYGGTYKDDPRQLQTQAESEGLEIVNNLVVNKEQRFPDIASRSVDSCTIDGRDSSILCGQEFHTSYWGHRGILDLKDHLLLPGYAGYPNTAAASLSPMNADVYDMAHRQGALVGAAHPFEKLPDPFATPAQRLADDFELPVDVALGKLDYMEIVGFSDHKSTAAVWYKLLDLGFKLPAGGGTDATTDYAAPIRGQVGFDRVYVWVPAGPLNRKEWLDGIKGGRTFATNGPLIDFTLGGEMVGSELKFDKPQAGVPFTAKLRSIVPVDHLELVCNGKVISSLLLDGAKETADMKGEIPLKQSGWCVLRAWSKKAEYPVLDEYAYATTSPVYVTIAGRRAYSKEDAEYFKAWIDRAIEITDAYPDWNSPGEKQGVMKKLREARAIYDSFQ
jgi:Tol biopolymer transport system component